jgi:hypothetical protein
MSSPFSEIRQKAEFKIVYILFRDTFCVPDGFEFGQYISKCFEKYSLRIVHIDIVSWVTLCGLVLLNFARVNLKFLGQQVSCSHSQLESDRSDCAQLLTHEIGMIIAFLFIYVLSVFVFGKIYCSRLIYSAGVACVDEYIDFLTLEDGVKVKNEAASETSGGSNIRLSSVQFKAKIEDLIIHRTKKEENHIGDKILSKITQSCKSIRSMILSTLKSDVDMSTKKPPPLKSSVWNSFKSDKIMEEGSTTKTFRRKSLSGRGAKPMSRMRKLSLGSEKVLDNFKEDADFSSIYLLQSPKLYFVTVELCIVFNAFYLSLWVTNFITIITYAHDWASNVVIQLCMLLPLVVLMPLITVIVQNASLLSAIAHLDVNIIGEVIEQSEDRHVLTDELRSKFKQRTLHSTLTPGALLDVLFDEIDDDNSGEISKAEFLELITKLGLCYSISKFRRLYDAVDHDKDGSLSKFEINRCFFPEYAEQQANKHRAETINAHIKRSIRQLEEGERVEATKPVIVEASNNEETGHQPVYTALFRKTVFASNNKLKLPSISATPAADKAPISGNKKTKKLANLARMSTYARNLEEEACQAQKNKQEHFETQEEGAAQPGDDIDKPHVLERLPLDLNKEDEKDRSAGWCYKSNDNDDQDNGPQKDIIQPHSNDVTAAPVADGDCKVAKNKTLVKGPSLSMLGLHTNTRGKNKCIRIPNLKKPKVHADFYDERSEQHAKM